jgi:anti-anti-sigma regulatory factor
MVNMATIAVWRTIDEQNIALMLKEAGEQLDSMDAEVLLDFSFVRKVDATSLRALEQFVGIADDKSVKVVLRSVNVDVYKVLKLIRLSSRFSFVS